MRTFIVTAIRECPDEDVITVVPVLADRLPRAGRVERDDAGRGPPREAGDAAAADLRVTIAQKSVLVWREEPSGGQSRGQLTQGFGNVRRSHEAEAIARV